MQYILSEQEFKNLINIEKYLLEKEKVEMLVKNYIKLKGCISADDLDENEEYFHCDGCPIGSLDNKLSAHSKVCPYQNYSK